MSRFDIKLSQLIKHVNKLIIETKAKFCINMNTYVYFL